MFMIILGGLGGSIGFIFDIGGCFPFSADYSPVSTATAPKWHSGGIDRASRQMCVNSVALAEPSTMQKCHFSGFARRSRQTIRRMKCHNCNFCHKTKD